MRRAFGEARSPLTGNRDGHDFLPTHDGARRDGATPRAGGRRRQLVHDREPVPRGPARPRLDAPAQVLRLLQRVASGPAPVGLGPGADPAWPRALAARPRPAQRLDEAIPPLGDATDRALDPGLAAVARARG